MLLNMDMLWLQWMLRWLIKMKSAFLHQKALASGHLFGVYFSWYRGSRCGQQLHQLHQIAKQVYNSKQMQVLEFKQCQASADISAHNPPLPAQSSDDSLFRMCGAEIARIIRVKTELQKGKIGTLHHRTDTREKEIQFLRACVFAMKIKGTYRTVSPKEYGILIKDTCGSPCLPCNHFL